MMRFDWEIEDIAEAERNRSAPVGPRRRWTWLLLLALAFMLAGGMAWRAVQKEVEEATTRREQEVRAAHALVIRAAGRQDSELLRSVLSGREQAWTAAQEERLEAGLLLGETVALLGWELVGSEEIESVTLSPELGEAQLVAAHTHRVGTEEERVRLRQVHIYRRGETRWLLSPPPAGFWGAWTRTVQGRITLVYPEREETFARALLPALTAAIEKSCAPDNAPCAGLQDLEIRLDPAAASVLNARDLPVENPGGTAEIVLPAPTLLGEATGEVAQTALVAGYTSVVAATVLDALSDYTCCAGRAFQEGLLAHRVELLGLPAWPPFAENYPAFADHPLSEDEFDALWAGRAEAPAARDQARAFVRFLLEEMPLPAEELQALLARSSDFRSWLEQIERSASTALHMRWESAWHHYLYREANRASGAAIALPDGALQLVCWNGAQEAGLYGYELRSRSWQEGETLAGDYPTLMPAPADRGVFIFDISPRELTRMGTTWRHAGAILNFDAPGADVVWRPDYTAMEDPEGQFVTMTRIATDEPIPEGIALFDMSTCNQAGCEWHTVPGRPVWSPDGRRLLLQTNGGDWLRGRRADLGQIAPAWETVPVGRAGQAFWTGSGEIGFVSPDRQQLALPTDGGERRSFPIDRLLAELPPAERAGHWRVATVVPALGRDDALLIALARSASEVEWLFLLESAGEQVTALLPVEDGAFNWRRHKALAEGGRWLVLTPFASPQVGPRFILYDLQARRVLVESTSSSPFNFHTYDWARDGRWLARLAPHAVELIAPAGGSDGRPARQFIPTPGVRCTSLAWVAGQSITAGRGHPDFVP